MMTKYGLKVAASIPAAGYGLFATKDLAAGTSIPIKGPWFSTLKSTTDFLASLEPATADKFRQRVVQVTLTSQEPGL